MTNLHSIAAHVIIRAWAGFTWTYLQGIVAVCTILWPIAWMIDADEELADWGERHCDNGIALERRFDLWLDRWFPSADKEKGAV
jgi:hypothetical protein